MNDTPLTPEEQALHDALLAEAALFEVEAEGLTDKEIEEAVSEAKMLHEQVSIQADALGIAQEGLTAKQLEAEVNTKEEELGIDYTELDHEEIMEAIKEKQATGVQSATDPLPASSEDRSEYNCPNCGGEGLVNNNTALCPVCVGTGKVN